MWIIGDRKNTNLRAGCIGVDGWEAMRAGIDRPPIVFSAFAAAGLPEHILPMILPDVRNEQVTGLSIEMKLVRIADPVRPYLRFGSNLDVRELLFGYPKEKHKAVRRCGGKWVITWHDVGNAVVRHVNIDAQDFAPEDMNVLSGV
jgi:hypothetical protein